MLLHWLKTSPERPEYFLRLEFLSADAQMAKDSTQENNPLMEEEKDEGLMKF